MKNHQVKTALSRCQVCNKEITASFIGNKENVCQHSECRLIVSAKIRMTATAYQAYLHVNAKRIQSSFLANKILHEGKEWEDANNRAYWNTIQEKYPEINDTSYPLVAIPSCQRRISNLPERRRRLFRDNFNKTLSSAMAEWWHNKNYHEIKPLVVESESTQFLNQACAACKGGCCVSGGERAYLDVATILRVLQRSPALRPKELLETYLSYLPRKSYQQSCVFHTEIGCALPNELRSTVCLAYYCQELKQIKLRFNQENQAQGVVLVVRSRDNWSAPQIDSSSISAAYILTPIELKQV